MKINIGKLKVVELFRKFESTYIKKKSTIKHYIINTKFFRQGDKISRLKW